MISLVFPVCLKSSIYVSWDWGLCTVQLHMFLKINMAFFVVCSIDCHYLVLFFRQAVFLDQWWRRFSFVSKRQLAALLGSGKLGVPGKQEKS